MTLSSEEKNRLKQSLSRVTSELPVKALREALEYRDAVTPMLLDALEVVKIREGRASSPGNSRFAVHALYLLTQLQEEKAWPLVIDLFSSMTSADNIAIGDDFDEIVCDALSQILATLCPGNGPGNSPDDIRPLQSIIENASIDEYVRDAALGALVVRYQQGDLELSVLTRYLQELYEFGLEQEKNQVWNAWVQACYNSQPDDFMDALKQLYEQELADAYYISLDEFSARCGMAPEKIKSAVMRQEGEFYCYLDDAVAGLRKLSCYSGEANDLLKSMENMVINQTAPKIQGASSQIANASIPYSENSGISVGRNDPCPCGSGKKFKKCCLH